MTVADVEIVVVFVFGGATSPFSSFLIKSLARDEVEFRRLNFLMFLDKNSGFRTVGVWKEIKRTENCD